MEIAICGEKYGLWINAIGVIIERNSVDEYKKNVDDVPIDDLELSVRAYNALKTVGINTIGDIKKRYLNNSPGPRDLGRTALKEVIEKINEMEMDIESS